MSFFVADPNLSIHRTYTYSTNSTASNLPGPGRTLDQFLGFLGRLLEDSINANHHPTSVDNAGHAQLTRVDTFSTNSTASNLPGPGRTLGLFLSFLGRKFDFALSRVAYDAGLGPTATKARLEANSGSPLTGSIPAKRRKKEQKKLIKDCRKLLTYTQNSQTLFTQFQAMECIVTLATRDLRLRECFVAINAYGFLQFAHHNIMCRAHSLHEADRTMLLSACRQALVCVEESWINVIAKELSHMLMWSEEELTTEQLVHAQTLLKSSWFQSIRTIALQSEDGTLLDEPAISVDRGQLLWRYRMEFDHRLRQKWGIGNDSLVSSSNALAITLCEWLHETDANPEASEQDRSLMMIFWRYRGWEHAPHRYRIQWEGDVIEDCTVLLYYADEFRIVCHTFNLSKQYVRQWTCKTKSAQLGANEELINMMGLVKNAFIPLTPAPVTSTNIWDGLRQENNV